jgi:polyhydroxyalkanoate synthesis regulator phasin
MIERKDSLNFLLGAVVGGIATYFVYKHKDDIVDKLVEIEGKLNIDHNEIFNNTKQKLDTMADKIKSTFSRFSGSNETTQDAETLLKEIAELKAEIQALKA